MPDTRQAFWAAKIAANRSRDDNNKNRLLLMGWRVLVVWECALRGRARLRKDDAIGYCAAFLQSDLLTEETISGIWPMHVDIT
jgi:DNA mismatch endonuclease (patch repair protein)